MDGNGETPGEGLQKAGGGAAGWPGSNRGKPGGARPSRRPGASPQSSSSRSRPRAAAFILVVAARSCSRRLRVWRSGLEASASSSGLSICPAWGPPTTGDKYLRAEQPRRLSPRPAPGVRLALPPGRPPPPLPPGSHRPRPAPVQQGAASWERSAATRGSPHTVRGSPAQKPLTRPSRSRSSHTWTQREPGRRWCARPPPTAAPAPPPAARHSPAGAGWRPQPSWAAPPPPPPPTRAGPPPPGGLGHGGRGPAPVGGSRIPGTPAAPGRDPTDSRPAVKTTLQYSNRPRHPSLSRGPTVSH